MEKEKIIIGYNRKSTKNQSLEADRETLEKNGCTLIFEEKKSGTKAFDRVELNKMLDYIKENADKFDIEVKCVKVDRLARSLLDLRKIIDIIVEQGARIEFIDNSLIFDAKKMDDPMSKAFLNLLGTFAELERDFIVARTTRGREFKRENDPDYKEGRKKKLNAVQVEKMYKLWKSGETATAVAELYNIGRTSFYTYLHEYEAKHSELVD
ncbi:recombinase family protein [Enterococcus casseliflavus]|nr:recombinase family protein [Enterococcus casseliflavus]